MIIGRLYNADSSRTNLPFATDTMRAVKPEQLSDLRKKTVDNFAYSGVMTKSIPTADAHGKPKDNGFHLLRFNDTRGGEQFLMRSQWQMDVTALGDYYDTTGGSRHMLIGGFDQKTMKCGGDLLNKVFRRVRVACRRSARRDVRLDAHAGRGRL